MGQSQSKSEPEVEGKEGREFESEPEPDADPCLMEEYPLPPIIETSLSVRRMSFSTPIDQRQGSGGTQLTIPRSI